MRRLVVTSIVLLVHMLLSVGASPAFADTYLDDLKVRHAFTNWFGKTRTNYVQLATNWVPDLAALHIINIVGGDAIPTTNADGTVESEIIFRATNEASSLVCVMAFQELSVSNAHVGMMGFFSDCALPVIEGTGSGVDVGDRCYLGDGTNEAFVCFVRNNIFLRVQARCTSSNCYSVVGIARALDEQILEISVGQ